MKKILLSFLLLPTLLFAQYTGEWKAGGGDGVTSVYNLAEMDSSSLADGKIWKYNSATGKWEIADDAGAASGAPTDATYITRLTNATLSAEFAMSSLATGIVKNTTGTGTPSIAVAGTDYQAPDAFLDDIAALTDPGGDRFLMWDDSDTGSEIGWGGFDALFTITGTTVGIDTTTYVATQYGLGLKAAIGGAHHDGFSDFVANEHINHTSVTLTAGDGLGGGGDISANRTFTVNVHPDSAVGLSGDSLAVRIDGSSIVNSGNQLAVGTVTDAMVPNDITITDNWTDTENTAAAYLPAATFPDSISASLQWRAAESTPASGDSIPVIVNGVLKLADVGDLPTGSGMNAADFPDSVVAQWTWRTLVTAVAGEDTILIRDQTDNEVKKALLPAASVGTDAVGTDELDDDANSPSAGDIVIVEAGAASFSYLTPGTGIAAALAINTGSAGAPVLFDGAGGTPSAITLTNGTGLPLTTGVTGTLPEANGGTGDTDLDDLVAGSAGLDVANGANAVIAGNVTVSLDVAPSAGSATLIEEQDALQVKYGGTLTESGNGLDVDTTLIATQNDIADMVSFSDTLTVIATKEDISGFISGNETITLSGDASGSGETAITVSINLSGLEGIADGDTLKVDLGTALYPIDLEVGDSRIFAVDSSGNVVVAGTVDGVDIAARDHDAVTLAGTPNYITIADQVITRSKLDLPDDINTFTEAQLETAVSDDNPIFDGDITGNGLVVRTGAGSYTNRSVAAGTAGLDVADGDGASGNPTISLDIAPSAGSATLEESDDALQVKYGGTLTESGNGLDVDTTLIATQSDISGLSGTIVVEDSDQSHTVASDSIRFSSNFIVNTDGAGDSYIEWNSSAIQGFSTVFNVKDTLKTGGDSLAVILDSANNLTFTGMPFFCDADSVKVRAVYKDSPVAAGKTVLFDWMWVTTSESETAIGSWTNTTLPAGKYCQVETDSVGGKAGTTVPHELWFAPEFQKNLSATDKDVISVRYVDPDGITWDDHIWTNNLGSTITVDSIVVRTDFSGYDFTLEIKDYDGTADANLDAITGSSSISNSQYIHTETAFNDATIASGQGIYFDEAGEAASYVSIDIHFHY